ncbi:cell growth regulator with EF hand domain protein 1 isoform X1 [Stigmatopora nigra]
MGACLRSLLPSALLLLVLQVHPSQGAPQREDPEKAPSDSSVLTNPFGSREEEQRLLQRYIELIRPDDVKINSRDEEVFYLFGLYDFDRSGHLDGLEMMKLLSDYNSQNAPEEKANDSLVSLVDFLLQSQDVDHDGLLAPSELLSPSKTPSEDNDIKILVEDQMVTLEKRMPDLEIAEEETKAEHVEEIPQEAREAHEESVQRVDEYNEQQIPERFAAEQRLR